VENVSRIVRYREPVREQKVREPKLVEVDRVEEWEFEKILNKLSCDVKPQMRATCTYMGCTKVAINNQDIRSLVTIKSLFANIS